MKRLVIAVCIFVFTIAFAVAGWFSVCSRIDSVVLLLKNDREITTTEGKINRARTNAIFEEWQKNEGFLVLLLTHYELEEIEIGIRCLRDYGNQGITEEYLKTLNECINQLEHVKATEIPDLRNIF